MFMTILMYLFLVVEVVSCLLLVTVILLQRSRSQGAGLAFGAGMGETLFGAQAGNVLTRTTVILAIVFLVNTTLLAFVQVRLGETSSSVVDSIEPVPTQPFSPAPMARPAPPPAPVAPTDAAWPEAVDLGDMTVDAAAAPAVPVAPTPEPVTIPAE